MMYTAVCLSDSNNTCSGFETERLAEAYILRHCCSDCAAEGIDSACAAEWLLISDDAYEHAEHLEDMFKAAGFTRIE